jgi:hypothetical protein
MNDVQDHQSIPPHGHHIAQTGCGRLEARISTERQYLSYDHDADASNHTKLQLPCLHVPCPPPKPSLRRLPRCSSAWTSAVPSSPKCCCSNLRITRADPAALRQVLGDPLRRRVLCPAAVEKKRISALAELTPSRPSGGRFTFQQMLQDDQAKVFAISAMIEREPSTAGSNSCLYWPALSQPPPPLPPSQPSSAPVLLDCTTCNQWIRRPFAASWAFLVLPTLVQLSTLVVEPAGCLSVTSFWTGITATPRDTATPIYGLAV